MHSRGSRVTGWGKKYPCTALCRCGELANKSYCDGAHHQLPPG
ncbi:CDGSH iron-sulfur domain-containing protein [Hymenobacter guriensis]|uniref:CDGSH iron-sulfur domain-containing protein n=1 Tax=Hymenobacter guriensis TaxID=2793065 RepID=A0ABS0KYE4_9BACT|nr:CDGSH iron-sulfur domain-containing protein [Hymenobacter guriensis]